jgi:hypothetical protein
VLQTRLNEAVGQSKNASPYLMNSPRRILEFPQFFFLLAKEICNQYRERERERERERQGWGSIIHLSVTLQLQLLLRIFAT